MVTTIPVIDDSLLGLGIDRVRMHQLRFKNQAIQTFGAAQVDRAWLARTVVVFRGTNTGTGGGGNAEMVVRVDAEHLSPSIVFKASARTGTQLINETQQHHDGCVPSHRGQGAVLSQFFTRTESGLVRSGRT